MLIVCCLDGIDHTPRGDVSSMGIVELKVRIIDGGELQLLKNNYQI